MIFSFALMVYWVCRLMQAAIRKELNDYKSTEMEVHEESRIYTRFAIFLLVVCVCVCVLCCFLNVYVNQMLIMLIMMLLDVFLY